MKIFAVFLILMLLAGGAAAAGQTGPALAGKIDNSRLMPKVVPDDRVQMERDSPDWVKSLILAELRIETATPEGDFAAATRVLDHYAEMGVNGLWVCPIWQRGSKRNGYGNFGLHTLEPELTGAADFEGSCAVVKRFVDEAHRRNIRVLFDIIVWGTRTDAPLVSEHPEFYSRTAGGDFVKVWGGYQFEWTNAALRRWFRDAAVNFILKTGADGYRVDCAPDTSGYFFREVRDELYAQGRKVVIMAESPAERRGTFDFEENGVYGWTELPDYSHPDHFRQQRQRFGDHNEYFLRANIVDAIQSGVGIGSAPLQQQGKGGLFRFYTSNELNHDDEAPFAKGNRVRFAYTALFSPFIPVWWIGEEWDNPKNFITAKGEGGVMYFNTIDWQAMESAPRRAFYEDLKRYLRIRLLHPEIFGWFPEHSREANIVKVASTRDGEVNPLQAYARFKPGVAGKEGEAVLIVPNYQSSAPGSRFEINPPYEAMGFPADARCTVTDLMTGRTLAKGKASALTAFSAEIAAEHLGVYLVKTK